MISIAFSLGQFEELSNLFLHQGLPHDFIGKPFGCSPNRFSEIPSPVFGLLSAGVD